MPSKHVIFISIILFMLATFSAGCTATSSAAPPGEQAISPVLSSPPDSPTGMPAPPGGNAGSTEYTLGGAFTVNGTALSESDGTYRSDTTDVSAIYVTNGGNLTLYSPDISTTGNTSSGEASSFYGLNGAILANNGSIVTVSGGMISTTGSGANGAIPTGSGTSITLSDMSINASGDGGHGVMATLGGSLTLTDVDISTTGAHGAPVATDRGSGTVNVTRGIIYSSGADSPGIYSTGNITVSDAVITSMGTEAAVIEGFNSIHLTNTTLAGGVEKTGGIMIYQSFSGDALIGTGKFTMTGGSYNATAGPAFFVTNTDAAITLSGVHVTGTSDTLIQAAGTSRWGTAGNNGGTVSFTADGETLRGNLVTDEISSIHSVLLNGSSLSGSINSAALTLDATSTWNVTGNSKLTYLTESAGIPDGSVGNIRGNNFTVSYNPALGENSWLGGKTYPLSNGGSLVPE